MRHGRRSSPYIFPAILAFCALMSWMLPTAAAKFSNESFSSAAADEIR